MASKSSESVKRLRDFFSANGFAFEVLELPGSARTAREAADNIGCEVAQIAKSLVFMEKETGLPILVIASGVNRVDLTKIEKETGLKLTKADGNYVKERTGYAIGGVPPAGHNETLETILDADLNKYKEIWAAAGTPFAVFKLKPADLGPLTNGRWMDLSE